MVQDLSQRNNLITERLGKYNGFTTYAWWTSSKDNNICTEEINAIGVCLFVCLVNCFDVASAACSLFAQCISVSAIP